jgi:hypothetical protein
MIPEKKINLESQLATQICKQKWQPPEITFFERKSEKFWFVKMKILFDCMNIFFHVFAHTINLKIMVAKSLKSNLFYFFKCKTDLNFFRPTISGRQHCFISRTTKDRGIMNKNVIGKSWLIKQRARNLRVASHFGQKWPRLRMWVKRAYTRLGCQHFAKNIWKPFPYSFVDRINVWIQQTFSRKKTRAKFTLKPCFFLNFI